MLSEDRAKARILKIPRLRAGVHLEGVAYAFAELGLGLQPRAYYVRPDQSELLSCKSKMIGELSRNDFEQTSR